MFSFSSLKTSRRPNEMERMQQRQVKSSKTLKFSVLRANLRHQDYKDELEYLKEDFGNKVKCDRNGRILDLLNKRASTSEAQIQANLARTEYEVKRARKVDREPTFKKIVVLKQELDSLCERRTRYRLKNQEPVPVILYQSSPLWDIPTLERVHSSIS